MQVKSRYIDGCRVYSKADVARAVGVHPWVITRWIRASKLARPDVRGDVRWYYTEPVFRQAVESSRKLLGDATSGGKKQ